MYWWSQCHLTGIPEIVCGRRDVKKQMITRVDYYQVDDLVANAKQAVRSLLMNFMAQMPNITRILKFNNLKTKIREE